jgi:hypothetical protein
MPVRYLACWLLFAVLVFVVVAALNGVFKNFDFNVAATIGVGFCIVALAATFAWDRYERKNSRNGGEQ